MRHAFTETTPYMEGIDAVQSRQTWNHGRVAYWCDTLGTCVNYIWHICIFISKSPKSSVLSKANTVTPGVGCQHVCLAPILELSYNLNTSRAILTSIVFLFQTTVCCKVCTEPPASVTHWMCTPAQQLDYSGYPSVFECVNPSTLGLIGNHMRVKKGWDLLCEQPAAHMPV